MTFIPGSVYENVIMSPGRRRASAKVQLDPSQIEEIAGVVESVVFRSEETGYTVCSVRMTGPRDPVTVVGSCAAIWVGETLKATGAWVRHPQHGMQFQTQSIVCIPPTSAKGLERYLASGMIRGIGKVMAKRLVDKFGEQTLQVIEKESARLEEVDGIGTVRRKMIKDSWIEQKAVRDIMIFLQTHGVGTGQAARIYRAYGGQSIAIICENPYRLCEDVWGIGFKTADGVAMSMGVPPHSNARARAGLGYTLQTMADEGHCYCPIPELVLKAQDLLEIPAEILGEALNQEIEEGILIRDDTRVYLPALYYAEVAIAAKIHALKTMPAPFKPILVDKAIPWAEQRMGIQFAATQADALNMALTEKVSIITGGPGVGKTTIIRALVDVYHHRSLSVALAAPTGRAAKRMEEATAHEAKTIHRMLKYMPRTGHFEHDEENPLEHDIIILDEVSMIDVALMSHFLRAVPEEAVLILVGDTDQLPSVGPGNVLRDLIDSGSVPSRKLETIFRQKTGGWIVQNAHHINQGEFIEVPKEGSASDFFFIETGEPEQVIQRVIELVADRIPKRFGFDPMQDIQVLTPMRKNQLGADNLNEILQETMNPGGPQVQRFGRKYREGDRVMQIRNNYDKDIYNGDIGRICAVDIDQQQVSVSFDGRRIDYDLAELDELVHAYACSIHKSQGCEYPVVVIALATQHYKLLQRNLLYTAITRGRQLACIVGSSKALRIAIRNNEIKLRRTGLRARLNQTIGDGTYTTSQREDLCPLPE